MLKYALVPVTPYMQNCSIVWCDQTRTAAVIDPGGNLDTIKLAIQKLDVKLEQIWITHGHSDHAAGAAGLAKELNIPIYGPHEADSYWLELLSQPEVRGEYGFEDAQSFTPTLWLHDGDTLKLGQEVIEVRHCPGHTPGHVIFYAKTANRAFVGDVLFAGSIGRTDFPGGNYDDLIQSIKTKLWPLGDDVVFIPGHGPESTFGRERQSNPYFNGRRGR